MAVAQAGGLKITHTVSPDMEGLKPELPFGQVKLSAYLLFYLAYRFDKVSFIEGTLYVVAILQKHLIFYPTFFLAALFGRWRCKTRSEQCDPPLLSQKGWASWRY